MHAVAQAALEILIGLVLLGAGALLAMWRSRTQRAKVAEAATEAALLQREETFDQIETLFRGHGANELTGDEAEPGLVTQIQILRKRQEEIALVAAKSASDAEAIRLELTRNGGKSTKDAAYQAARSAEAAAAAAELAARSAGRTESLMKRHMENGLEIMEVGQHNDGVILRAVESLGGEVEDYRPFPPVDIGD
jgi:hypothetical protein